MARQLAAAPHRRRGRRRVAESHGGNRPAPVRVRRPLDLQRRVHGQGMHVRRPAGHRAAAVVSGGRGRHQSHRESSARRRSTVLRAARVPRDRSRHPAGEAERRRRAHVGSRPAAYASLHVWRKPVRRGLPPSEAGPPLPGDPSAGGARPLAGAGRAAPRHVHDDCQVEEKPRPAGRLPERRNVPVEQGPRVCALSRSAAAHVTANRAGAGDGSARRPIEARAAWLARRRCVRRLPIPRRIPTVRARVAR